MKSSQILMLWCLLLTFFVFVFKDRDQMKEALDSCLVTVQEKCGPVIEYASLLESENAKVNKKLRECIKQD